jgi:hypothetical protein
MNELMMGLRLMGLLLQEVLATYHDSYLYGEVPFTTKVRTALRGWPLGNVLMWVRQRISAFNCA